MPTFADGDYLVMRIVPLANTLGATFYYTNQTTNSATTITTDLYSSQIFTNTTANTFLYAGTGIYVPAGGNSVAYSIDYMGLQSATQRIYS